MPEICVTAAKEPVELYREKLLMVIGEIVGAEPFGD